jgi:hypothetical protein
MPGAAPERPMVEQRNFPHQFRPISGLEEDLIQASNPFGYFPPKPFRRRWFSGIAKTSASRK